MLVPSTFTGRYKNRITRTAIRTDSIKSRNQAMVVMTADRDRSDTSGAEPDTVAIASGTDSLMSVATYSNLQRTVNRCSNLIVLRFPCVGRVSRFFDCPLPNRAASVTDHCPILSHLQRTRSPG